MQWQARLFDGRSSNPIAVVVSLGKGTLCVNENADVAESTTQDVKIELLDISEHFIGAPRMIALPDGRTLQVEDDATASFDQALNAAGTHQGFASRLIQSWRNVGVCIVALIALIIWIDRQGAGLIANAILYVVPTSVDQRLGRAAFQIIEEKILAPTDLSLSRRETLHARFAAIMREQYPDREWRLAFRTMQDKEDAINAFALPDGTMVVLDGLVDKMSDDEVLAVLGHELGHVVYRHTMKGLARNIGLVAAASVVWGDISSFASTAAAGLPGLSFHRDAESEADVFAIAYLRRAGMSPRLVADAFSVLKKELEKHGEPPEFLSTHPSTEERIRKAEEAAQKL